MVCAVTALLGYTIGSVIGLLILNEYEKYSYICFIDRDYKEKVNFVKWLFYRICNRINETFQLKCTKILFVRLHKKISPSFFMQSDEIKIQRFAQISSFIFVQTAEKIQQNAGNHL